MTNCSLLTPSLFPSYYPLSPYILNTTSASSAGSGWVKFKVGGTTFCKTARHKQRTGVHPPPPTHIAGGQ